MNRLLKGALALSLLAGVAGTASADERRNDGYQNGGYQNGQDYRNGQNQYNNGRNDNGARWSTGQRISRSDWNRGRVINYKEYNLNKAPRGYEWREIDGNYIQASRSGGLITVVVLSQNGGYRNGGYQDNQYEYNNGRYDNGKGHRHHWRRGRQIDQADWDRGRPVDYRTYNLSEPSRGNEWREVDGNYVQAALIGGLISAVIVASQNR